MKKGSAKAHVERTEDRVGFGRNLGVTFSQLSDLIPKKTLDSVVRPSIQFIFSFMEQQGFASFNKFPTITTEDLFGLHQKESKQ